MNPQQNNFSSTPQQVRPPGIVPTPGATPSPAGMLPGAAAQMAAMAHFPQGRVFPPGTPQMMPGMNMTQQMAMYQRMMAGQMPLTMTPQQLPSTPGMRVGFPTASTPLATLGTPVQQPPPVPLPPKPAEFSVVPEQPAWAKPSAGKHGADDSASAAPPPPKRLRVSTENRFSVPANMRHAEEYKSLLASEQKLEDIIRQKFLSLRTIYREPKRLQLVLRLYVFNTFDYGRTAEEIQFLQSFSKNYPHAVYWTLRIHGDIIDRATDQVHPKLKFTDFLDRIYIQLDPQSCVVQNKILNIDWRRSELEPSAKGFAIRRLCANPRQGKPPFQHFGVEMILYPREQPPRFVVNDPMPVPAQPQTGRNPPPAPPPIPNPLRPLLSVPRNKALTTRELLSEFWSYVEANQLYDPEDPRFILISPEMRDMFGDHKRFPVSQVLDVLEKYVTPSKPILIRHQLRLQREISSNVAEWTSAQYDIALESDDTSDMEEFDRFRRTVGATCDAECAQIDAEIEKLLEDIRQRTKHVEMLKQYAADPRGTLARLAKEQLKDLEEISKEAVKERELRTDFFTESWVPEAVVRYLVRKG